MGRVLPSKLTAGIVPRDIESARAVILRHGWNTTCYQVMNPGIEHWTSSTGDALVGYVRSAGVALVAGAPICAPDRLPNVVVEWESFVQRQGLEVAYFAAESRLQSLFASSPAHKQVVIGSQPEWRPERFVEAVDGDPSLRKQLHRARNKGLTVQEHTGSTEELRRVLEEWLSTRGLPTLHFLVEPETLGDLRDRRILVARLGHEVVGFTTLCPIPARKGWLTEQFVRGKDAPNGAVESMLYRAATLLAEEGHKFFTMGMAPLLLQEESDLDEPAWLRFLRRWGKAHMSRFYNFGGLGRFKSKFHPDQWSPVVVIVRADAFRWKHLRAIAGAFSQSAPELAVARGLLRAVRQEFAWLTRRS